MVSLPIPRKQLKELMQRTRRAGDPRHHHLVRRLRRLRRRRLSCWGTWWCVPFFLVYGVLYGSSTDSRWHECGHGTAFKTRWMNDVDLSDRLLHDHARTDGLALEPYAPPHRHHHRRPRSGDRRAAAAGPRSRILLNFFGAARAAASLSSTWSCMPSAGSPPRRRPSSRRWSAEGLSDRPHLDRDLSPR